MRIVAKRYWNQRSRLLLPTRLRLTTTKVTTVHVDTRVVGSAWVPCTLDVPEHLRENREKAMCAFLNSSVGVLALLGNRTNKIPASPNLSIDDLRKLPVPDFETIGDGAVWMLAIAYDCLAEESLCSLSWMDTCDTRLSLDESVCAALNIDPEMVAGIRRQLAAEPSVTGRQFFGLRPSG